MPSGTNPAGRAQLGQVGSEAGSRGVVRPAARQREDTAPLRPTQAPHAPSCPLGCLASQRAAPAASDPFPSPYEAAGAPRRGAEAPEEGQGTPGASTGLLAAPRAPYGPTRLQRTGRRLRSAREGGQGRARLGRGGEVGKYNTISCQLSPSHPTTSEGGSAARGTQAKGTS